MNTTSITTLLLDRETFCFDFSVPIKVPLTQRGKKVYGYEKIKKFTGPEYVTTKRWEYNKVLHEVSEETSKNEPIQMSLYEFFNLFSAYTEK